MKDVAGPYPHVFEPIELAGKRLRNRIAHAAILTSTAAQSRVTDRLIRYHENRARGGVAMIVTEPMCEAPHQKSPFRVLAWNDSAEDGLKRWAEAVEQHDCRLVGQIQDPGRGRHIPGRNPDAVGAAAQPDDLSWTVPHVLTVSEIHALVESFADSAARMQRCGFSGVELSAGHGHLFHQFMSPWSNTRADAYGGDFEGRVRIVVEIIDAIRAKCGRNFILGLKLPGDDGVPGGIGPELALTIARRLSGGGQADYLTFAQGSHHRTLEMHIPDDYAPRVTYGALIGAMRRALPHVPVMSLGRITDPAEAEGLIARGDADMVMLGRALIADPEWPRKAMEGRARDIRYCVSHNTCWANIVGHAPLVCDNNPRVGMPDEVDWQPVKVTQRKRIVVVGAGVAGMEAAWVAAARGHQVTVLGRSPEVGGKTRLHASLPGSESLSSVYDYQRAAAERAGVELVLGREATAADVLALRPDEVILATGATMIWPRCLPDALQDEGYVAGLREAIEPLVGRASRQQGTAVVFDMDHTDGTYAAVDLLHRLFERVVIITPREGVAHDAALVSRQGVQRRNHEKGIVVMPLAEPDWSEEFETRGRLGVRSVFGGRIGAVENVAFFAYSTPRTPDDALAAPIRAAGIPVHLVGDCRNARAVLAATAEGNAIGMSI